MNLAIYSWGLPGALLLALSACSDSFSAPAPFGPRQLGVVINLEDPLSRQIGAEYQRLRQIPPENVIRVSFPPQGTTLPPKVFERLAQDIKAQSGEGVQGYALAWTQPYRVGCMSVTSAVTLGFDPSYCARGCSPTALSPYFNQATRKPYSDLGLRPAMMLASRDFPQAQALMKRGVAADGSAPTGTAYLVSTTDKARNVRASGFPQAKQILGDRFRIEILRTDSLKNRRDVMFYFTGLPRVTGLETLVFRPGAMADHLTSTGGQLTDSGQMSSLRWLEAGATASYGAVVEPCNFPQKFPHPGLAMQFYLNGETVLESYWKSVAWPGQGVFIGEPLARPFSRVK
ncbi:MAG: TIGR03790 family protein [Cyanobacteriota bacterium]|nr:TIGR03790 family protein [Cyanobacteriota bacterium]